MTANSEADDADVAAHGTTYHRFMLGVKWVSIHLASVLVFLIIGFATRAGVVPGLIAGVLVFAIGVYAMGHGLAHSTENDNPHNA